MEVFYMYLRIFNKEKGPYLVIYEKYHVPGKGCREKVVKTIGYASNYADQYDDPIAHFTALAKEMTDKQFADKHASVPIDMYEKMSLDTDDVKNLGYCVLKLLYKELELDKFWKKVTSKAKIQYDADKIFQMLLFSRILFPASKKKSFESMNIFFEDFGDFSLDDVYHALDIFAVNEASLQTWIYDHSVTLYDRDLSVGYFDCTNYYYDISKPDIDDYDDDGNLLYQRYRKYGPEKNHRKDPIVQLGLLMDKSGIPLAYDLFPGNESEKVHMLPIINRARNDFGFGRIIVVADRGLNTSDNIYFLNGKNDKENNPRDGYVYGQSIRGADKAFKKWVLSEKGYIKTKVKSFDKDLDDDVDDDAYFIHKSRTYPKKIKIKREKSDGKIVKQTITVDQKQMVYFSNKYAKKQKLERDRAVERAKDLITHPKKYDKLSAKGASGYVMNLSFDKETGEVIDHNLILDEEKIKEEEKYDGYYSIVTSELKMDDIELRETYRGLIRIEDTFKITKSEFDTRPIYVRLNEHIDAHFTICFTAIVLIRLLQIRLNNQYPVGKILEALKKYTCNHMGQNIYKLLYYNKIIEDCGKSFNIDFQNKYKTRQEIRQLLKY